VGVEFCVVGRCNSFVVEHLVGWERFHEKQVDASSGTVFLVEAA
jgi:hypothetical protein